MKREIYAIAIGSLFVLAPSALADVLINDQDPAPASAAVAPAMTILTPEQISGPTDASINAEAQAAIATLPQTAAPVIPATEPAKVSGPTDADVIAQMPATLLDPNTSMMPPVLPPTTPQTVLPPPVVSVPLEQSEISTQLDPVATNPVLLNNDQVGPSTLDSACQTESAKDARRRAKEEGKATQRMASAQKVLDGIYQNPGSQSSFYGKEKKVPEWLLDKGTACIAVIPKEKSGGIFGIGATYGAGIVTCARNASTGQFDLTQGHYVQLKGGSYGPQFGYETTDQVLAFKNADAVDQLMNDHSIQLGVHAAAAAGPWGRDATAQTDTDFKDKIASYSSSGGLYFAADLTGAVLSKDNAMNASLNCASLPKPQNFFQRFLALFHHKSPNGNDDGVTSDAQVSAKPLAPGGTIGIDPAPAQAADNANGS